MIKQLATRLLPNTLQKTLQPYYQQVSLQKFRKKVEKKTWGESVDFLNYDVRITDGPNFYIQFKDEFVNKIYHFEAQRNDPLIIDGGSNIGMSILYFKKIYPEARIIGFEPDPKIYELLEGNVSRNGLNGVTLVNSGLSAQEGEGTFQADGSAGGYLGDGSGSITVRLEKLSAYLSEPVDFLKLNIEGEELPVLEEVARSGKLRNVRELVLEYHSWPNVEQRMGAILSLLDREGFRYLIHDFDEETSQVTKPPFQWTDKTMWFCLVYAKNVGSTVKGTM
ncbi:FkbM family methyltransferase [Candidatus Nitrospira salsa]